MHHVNILTAIILNRSDRTPSLVWTMILKDGSISLFMLLALLLFPANVHGQDAEVAIDLARLSPDTARFALLQQDNRIGEIVVTLTKEGATWKMNERTETPSGFQETSVTFVGGPRMVSVEQHGKMGPAEIATDVTYAEGRVTGRAIVPSMAGLDTVDVDAVVPPTAIDDNALLALLPALELAPGMSFALPVFSAGKNALFEYSVNVRTGDPLEWRGEPAATLRVETIGGPAGPVSFVVTKSRPHLVLRILPPGPMRIERLGE